MPRKPRWSKAWVRRLQPGDRVYFEYHCEEHDDSCDAVLWYHSRQWATVVRQLRYPDEVDYETAPMVYLRFDSGFVGTANNDEVAPTPEAIPNATVDGPPELTPERMKRVKAAVKAQRGATFAGLLRGGLQ